MYFTNKIQSHLVSNVTIYSKINFKVEISSTLDIRSSSHASFSIANNVCFENPKLNPTINYTLVENSLLIL